MNERPQWPRVRLREVLRLDRVRVPVDAVTSYPMVGVLSFGRGLFERESIENGKTSYRVFYRLKAEHVVMSQLFGWEGALALSSAAFAGKYLSPQFPTFLCDGAKLDRGFLGWLMRRPVFWKDLGSRASGMGDRRRTLNPEALFACEIPLPPVLEQRRIVARIEALAAEIAHARQLRNQAAEEAEALFASKLRHTIQRCGSSVRMVPLDEVATLVRRPVKVELEKNYREIGVFCFGRGIFHKTPRSGAEVGGKELIQIHAGDVILQVTFSWEGAVALAENRDHGLCGSVRYLTFRANENLCSPRYLHTYLRTPEAIRELARISPGSAGRNRVLSVKRLNEVMIPIVPLPEQAWLTDALQAELDALKRLQAETAAEIDALLPAVLDRAFKGEL